MSTLKVKKNEKIGDVRISFFHVLFEPILGWFCCCCPCVKRNQKLLDDGMDIIDEELEIIGLLKSKFNPESKLIIDLDAESGSEDKTDKNNPEEEAEIEMTKNQSDSKLIDHDGKVPLKIDTLEFSSRSSGDEDSF